MNTDTFKIGDIVSIMPFGECPIHYCRIEKFELNSIGIISAIGKWYSKEANCVSDTGFDINYIDDANEADLNEAVENYKLKNSNNNLWYAARENFFTEEKNVTELDFIAEFKRLMTDGEHPFDCKCIIHV